MSAEAEQSTALTSSTHSSGSISGAFSSILGGGYSSSAVWPEKGVVRCHPQSGHCGATVGVHLGRVKVLITVTRFLHPLLVVKDDYAGAHRWGPHRILLLVVASHRSTALLPGTTAAVLPQRSEINSRGRKPPGQACQRLVDLFSTRKRNHAQNRNRR